MKVNKFSDLPPHIQKLNADKLENAMTASTANRKGLADAIHDKYTRESLEGLRNDLKRSFVLKVKLISNNRGQGHHWSKSHKLRKHYEKVIIRSGHARKTPPEETQELTITRILGKGERAWDLPNIPLATKQLIDALVATNHLKDDNSNDLVKVSYLQDATQRELGPAVKIEFSRHREERKA